VNEIYILSMHSHSSPSQADDDSLEIIIHDNVEKSSRQNIVKTNFAKTS
jgi:hypothetical protein